MKLIHSFIDKSHDITTTFLYSNISPLPGTEIGIPINIFENIFTNLHYGSDIHIPYFIIISLLIGHVTYGTDRYFDALEHFNSKDTIEIPKRKLDLYNYILNNQKILKTTIIASNIALFSFFQTSPETAPFILLLLLSNFYRQIKTKYGLLKAPFIGVMWTVASIILPCVIHDHNYDILKDFSCYLPAFFSLYASSNTADISDVKEDKQNNIETFPVKFGVENAIYINLIFLFISSLLFSINPNFMHRPLINSLFELNNVGVSFANLKAFNNTYLEDTINFNLSGNYTINI